MPDYRFIEVEERGEIALITLNRPEKRNAVSDDLLADLEAFFSTPPKAAKVVVIHGAGGHFCAGLDLSEHKERDAFGVMKHSQHWHQVFDRIQFGGLAVVSALKGAVIGGGLELATATHVRVAEPSAIFQLPEGRRGIYVGGGASVRVARIIGADRMTEMMLTGRVYGAEDGLRLGLAHYLVEEGEALPKALELAAKIAGNAPLSNYMMLNALQRISDMPGREGFWAESLAAALTQTSEDAKEGMRAFLEKRETKFGKRE